MKIIIAAGGSGSRWKNFRGTEKHLTNVEGEILIERTISQFKKYTDDIVVVCKNQMHININTELPIEGNWNDAAKLYSSAHLWENKRNIVVFGDVWFSDEAVKKIINNSDPVQFFLRPGPSKITGKKYKEIFAVAFDGEQISNVRNTLEQVIQENLPGPGTYLFYKKIRNLENVRSNRCFDNKGYYVEINDWTEDFDHPHDLEIWEKRRLKFGTKKVLLFI